MPTRRRSATRREREKILKGKTRSKAEVTRQSCSGTMRGLKGWSASGKTQVIELKTIPKVQTHRRFNMGLFDMAPHMARRRGSFYEELGAFYPVVAV
ncbi:MAG: hypothetical protein ACREXP_16045, partial [Steroidobacteraceae bacterium]